MRPPEGGYNFSGSIAKLPAVVVTTGGPPVQQIADWLEKLGLSEHTDRFADNKIDVSVLPHLTDEDLKEIGVPLGHRRKIFAAINQGAAPVHFETKAQDAAERRHVTVMFSDLVGSTALSERMDPEDLREVISAYQNCVAQTVHRFDGFIAKYMGDGVLVYFGYPEAHEDDPERAVRAALALVGCGERSADTRCTSEPCRYCEWLGGDR
jgi:SAM (Sterile alpha motif) domain-containing protein/adenylate/guanylate cyclase family protein